MFKIAHCAFGLRNFRHGPSATTELASALLQRNPFNFSNTLSTAVLLALSVPTLAKNDNGIGRENASADLGVGAGALEGRLAEPSTGLFATGLRSQMPSGKSIVSF